MSDSEDQCGIWIDTEQLRGKAQQRKAAPPISKLLNPGLRGGGFRVAVALSVARTPSPRTRQSSISSFFAPRPRSSSCEQATPLTSGAKRHSATSNCRDGDAACHSTCERKEEEEVGGSEGKRRRAAPSASRHPELETAGVQSKMADDGPDATTADANIVSILPTSPLMDPHNPPLSPGQHTEVPSLLEPLTKEDDKGPRPDNDKTLTSVTLPTSVTSLTSLASLFTQDSEGFRVMAHGTPRGRAECWLDEEDVLLFTQDTQGNTVIKH